MSQLPSAPKEGIPEGLWLRCPECGDMLFRKVVEEALQVCPGCQHHFRVSARIRVAQLVDPGSFEEMFEDFQPTDPLKFVDKKAYKDRLKDEQRHIEQTSERKHANMEERAGAIDAKEKPTQAHSRRDELNAAGRARAAGHTPYTRQGGKNAERTQATGKTAEPGPNRRAEWDGSGGVRGRLAGAGRGVDAGVGRRYEKE